MDLKNLITEAYKIACDKGWHDTEVSFSDYIANVHAEISEAWEEWRNNRGLDEIYYECSREKCKFLKEKVELSRRFIDCQGCESAKPCGIPVELADVLIRIADMLGAYNVDLNKKPISKNKIAVTFGDFIVICHSYLPSDDYLKFESLIGLIKEIETYCIRENINLEKAIELKMAYNRTRSYRHNGKRV